MESKVAKNTSNCRSLSVSLLCNCAPIKQVLQQNLKAAIALSSRSIATSDLHNLAEVTSETIPLHRLSDDTGVLYRSAIAFKLAPLWQQPALDIASQLIASLPTITQDIAGSMYLDFNVEVLFPGWISFRLSDQGLAAWLQQLIQIPPSRGEEGQGRGREGEENTGTWEHEYTENLVEELSESPLLPVAASSSPPRLSPKDAHNLFPVQYAHARCCSLLRLAHTQSLIKLRDFDFKTVSCQLVEPNPIPWLNNDQGVDMATGPLRLIHPAERRLIAQLLDVPDVIGNPGELSCVKLAIALSNTFEQFYSRCRIWGEVKTQAPQLAQARLGLVAVTQGFLRSLLEDQMGVPAPVAL